LLRLHAPGEPDAALPEIHEQFRKASDEPAKRNLILLLENEHTCNTATGAEAASALAVSNVYDLLPKIASATSTAKTGCGLRKARRRASRSALALSSGTAD
jgi:hypothetical protein